MRVFRRVAPSEKFGDEDGIDPAGLRQINDLFVDPAPGRGPRSCFLENPYDVVIAALGESCQMIDRSTPAGRSSIAKVQRLCRARHSRRTASTVDSK